MADCPRAAGDRSVRWEGWGEAMHTKTGNALWPWPGRLTHCVLCPGGCGRTKPYLPQAQGWDSPGQTTAPKQGDLLLQVTGEAAHGAHPCLHHEQVPCGGGKACTVRLRLYNRVTAGVKIQPLYVLSLLVAYCLKQPHGFRGKGRRAAGQTLCCTLTTAEHCQMPLCCSGTGLPGLHLAKESQTSLQMGHPPNSRQNQNFCAVFWGKRIL